MKEIDRRAIEEFGIPSIVLMENAGRKVAEAALGMLSDRGSKKVVCVCGRGNNAGDGFVCARHLVNNGIDTEIFLTEEPLKLKKDAQTNLDILRKMKARIEILKSGGDFKIFEEKLTGAELLIDAIFGIGLSGEIKEPYSAVIEKMNQSGKPILAVDAPSGLDAATGDIFRVCIKAKKTVTFALPKTGFIKNCGPSHTGELIVADISIPKEAL